MPLQSLGSDNLQISRLALHQSREMRLVTTSDDCEWDGEDGLWK